MASAASVENDRLALIGHKRCSKCGMVLPFAEFHQHRPSRGGLHPRCRKCRRAGSVGAYMRRLEAESSAERLLAYERKLDARRLSESGARRCSLCRQVKEKKHFRVLSTTKTGKGGVKVQLSPECNDCRTVSARSVRQAENKEMAERGERRCKSCNGVFPLTSGFYRSSHGGYQAHCKTCYNRVSNGRRDNADD